MRYREIEPNDAAKRFVLCDWVLEDPAPDWEVQRTVPDGRAELILNLAQPSRSSTGQSMLSCMRPFQIRRESDGARENRFC